MSPSSRRPVVLIGVDESDSSRAAVRKVLDIFSEGPRPRLVLLHVMVQKIPPHLEYIDPSMVWDGAGIPTSLEGESAEEGEHRRRATGGRFERWFGEIAGEDWPADEVEVQVVEGGFSRAAIAELLAYHARESKADIIVVGRTRHGALHEALIKSTGERLVNYARGLSVWVVSTPTEDGRA